jgi:hypothetical protein
MIEVTKYRNCDICKNSYIPRNKQSMFCSPDCKRQGRNTRLKRQSVGNKKIIKVVNNVVAKTTLCLGCQQEFIPKHSGNVYCCEKCRTGKDKWVPKIILCFGCNKEFVQKYHNNKYCNKQCAKCPYEITTKGKLKTLITESRRAQGKCANCEETDIRLFEFAHYSREDKTLRSVSQHQCLSAVREEFKKGRWLCVWCHRRETTDENLLLYKEKTKASRERSRSKKYVDDIKLNIGQCCLCELAITPDTLNFFEFDHIDQSTKSSTISNLIGFAKKTIDAEIAKCRLLCCKCHRLHTIAQANEHKPRINTVLKYMENTDPLGAPEPCHGNILIKVLNEQK